MMTPTSVYSLGKSHGRGLIPGALLSSCSRGFTLLELLLVLSIIGLASVLVVPSLGNLESRTFSAQVRQATSLLNHARRLAVVQGQPGTATFFAVTEEEEQKQAHRSSVGSWQSEGAQVRFLDSTEREIDVEDMIEVTFYPEGGSTGGTLVLIQDEQEVHIIVDPFTGRISTETADER